MWQVCEATLEEDGYEPEEIEEELAPILVQVLVLTPI